MVLVARSEFKNPNYPTEEDLKFANMTHTDHSIFCTREFNDLKDIIIDVENMYDFCGLTSFFYKDYCCVIDRNKYSRLDEK